MSISSMAEVAFFRRTDVAVPETPSPPVNTVTPAPQTSVSTALKVIATYIPTEVLTLYVAVLAAIRTPAQTGRLKIAFYSFLILTPVVVWLVYAAKCKAGGKGLPLAPRTWPLWEMFAASVAYAAWAFTLADNPFALEAWYSSGLAAVMVLIVSTLMGLLAPLFQRPIPS